MSTTTVHNSIRLLWRWSWLILLSAAIAGAGAYSMSWQRVPTYAVSTTLLITPGHLTNAAPAANALDAPRAGAGLAKTHAQLLRTTPVMEQVIANLQLDMAPQALANRVLVRVVPSTQLVTLWVEDTDPQRAAAIANEAARVSIAQNRQRQAQRYAVAKQGLELGMARLQTAIRATQKRLAADGVSSAFAARSPDVIARQSVLQAQLAQYFTGYAALLNTYEAARLAEAETSDSLGVVERARPAASPTRPLPHETILVAALVAASVVIGLLLLRDQFDDSVRSPEEVEDLLGISTLVATGRIRGMGLQDKLVMLKNARSEQAEVYRMLGVNIDFSVANRDIRTILVTSSEPLEGKSLVVANLAIALAQSGKRVVLVDTNLRRPTLHTFFRKRNTSGLTTALLEDGYARPNDYLLETGVNNLFLLPSGPPPANPTQVLSSQALGNFIQALRASADVVLFDSPSLLTAVDAALLARRCDAALLIVMAGGTHPAALCRAKEYLAQSGTRILGAVFNGDRNAVGSYAHV